MPLFKIQLLHVLCTGILLYFQMYIIQITLATPFEQFHQMFSMKDLPLPQQAQDTKYWKDSNIVIIVIVYSPGFLQDTLESVMSN